jgi:hypothetical protein
MPQRLGRFRAVWLSFRPALLEGAGVILFFTAVAVFATWPLAIHPLGGFYGFGNDNWGGIPYFGWLHDAYLGPADASFDPELQAPFGLEIPEHAMQPMDRLFSLLFGGFQQGLGTYNAQIFSSFVLAGCTMYLAARYLTGSRPAALVAGFAFTFSPFHLSVAMQYNALASIQWIPLYLLALIVLLRRGGKRDAVLTGGAFALVALTSYYYAWFLGWFTALVVAYFVLAAAWRLRRSGRSIRSDAGQFMRLALSRGALAAGAAVVAAVPFLVVSARGAAKAGTAVIEHPITEAVRYSARPWMFFVPPHDNPIVGERVRPWVMNHIFESPVYEQSIYLGYTVLALAVIALWRLRDGELPPRARFARSLLVVGALAGALIMIGPYIPLERGYWRHWQTPDATARIPSLGWLMYELGPVFRFFTRAFVLVSACMALLAAIGTARLTRLHWMTQTRRLGLAALMIGLIGLEYTNAPPHVWFSANKPAWVAAVHRLPEGSSVVDYPISPAFAPRSLYYMFWQTKHRRATANPQLDPDAAALAATIASPDDPGAGEALSRAGIDYAIVHTSLPPQTRVPYQPQLPDDSMPADAGALNPWLQPAMRTTDAVVYRVLSKPRRVSGSIARPTSGFGASEPEGSSRARWLEQPTGTLTFFVAGKPRPLRLTLTISSFVQPRRVLVRLDGRTVAALEAFPGSYLTRPIPLGRPVAGRHTVEIEAHPGPQSITEATGSTDPRSVSIRLREPIAVRPG